MHHHNVIAGITVSNAADPRQDILTPLYTVEHTLRENNNKSMKDVLLHPPGFALHRPLGVAGPRRHSLVFIKHQNLKQLDIISLCSLIPSCCTRANRFSCNTFWRLNLSHCHRLHYHCRFSFLWLQAVCTNSTRPAQFLSACVVSEKPATNKASSSSFCHFPLTDSSLL